MISALAEQFATVFGQVVDQGPFEGHAQSNSSLAKLEKLPRESVLPSAAWARLQNDASAGIHACLEAADSLSKRSESDAAFGIRANSENFCHGWRLPEVG